MTEALSDLSDAATTGLSVLEPDSMVSRTGVARGIGAEAALCCGSGLVAGSFAKRGILRRQHSRALPILVVCGSEIR